MPSTITSSGQSGFAVPTAVLSAELNGAANAVTFHFRTATGNPPSPTEPLFTSVRDANGNVTGLPIVNALDLTISNGSTMGVDLVCGGSIFGSASVSPFKLWLVQLYNGDGTFSLAVKNCLSGDGNIFPLAEFGFDSAVAEGGAGGADSAGVFYAPATITNKFYRIIGYAEWANGFGGSVGVWSSLPTSLVLYGPGVATPGSVVQQTRIAIYHSTNYSTVIPVDGTVPQSSEGDLVFTTPSLTPKLSSNILEFEVRLNISSSLAKTVSAALFQGAASSALLVAANDIDGSNNVAQIFLDGILPVDSLSARTYSVRIGPSSTPGTVTVNGKANVVSLFASGMQSHLKVREIMV